MNLVRYNPFNLFEEFDRMFNTACTPQTCGPSQGASWTPAVDIQELEKEFVIKADIPGVDPKEIELTYESGMLTLRGMREHEETTEKEGFQTCRTIQRQL